MEENKILDDFFSGVLTEEYDPKLDNILEKPRTVLEKEIMEQKILKDWLSGKLDLYKSEDKELQALMEEIKVRDVKTKLYYEGDRDCFNIIFGCIDKSIEVGLDPRYEIMSCLVSEKVYKKFELVKKYIIDTYKLDNSDPSYLSGFLERLDLGYAQYQIVCMAISEALFNQKILEPYKKESSVGNLLEKIEKAKKMMKVSVDDYISTPYR